MKKTLMKVSLLSMMLGLMPIAMTSCKDYDDDITTINETTGSLDAQIKALQAAIEANKQAAQAAHDAADAALKAAQEAAEKGDQAEADAQKAMAMAKAAEEAAAQAKAEALAEIIKQCQALQARSMPTRVTSTPTRRPSRLSTTSCPPSWAASKVSKRVSVLSTSILSTMQSSSSTQLLRL